MILMTTLMIGLILKDFLTAYIEYYTKRSLNKDCERNFRVLNNVYKYSIDTKKEREEIEARMFALKYY